MKLFKCQRCANMVYFDNDHCEQCKSTLAYVPELSTISVIEADGSLLVAGAAKGVARRFCANQTWGACNWLIAEGDGEEYCAACRHNRTIADLHVEENLALWRRVERAKHHLFYTLQQLRLPLANRRDAPETGLAFDFLADTGTAAKVMTGHDHGLITLNIAEADDAYREQLRTTMGEPYRTLLGHFRHEVGHYFWDVLVDRGGRLDAFRARFGDERPDYDESLKKYYASGPAPNWPENFVSAYASAHPWEDFAETWAHYLHIVDTLEMAGAFGLRISPAVETAPELDEKQTVAPSEATGIESLITAWVPVTLAVNGLNRCMGQPDLYPFVITEAVTAKLGFIHDLIHQQPQISK
jgi:hypothetical protein